MVRGKTPELRSDARTSESRAHRGRAQTLLAATGLAAVALGSSLAIGASLRNAVSDAAALASVTPFASPAPPLDAAPVASLVSSVPAIQPPLAPPLDAALPVPRAAAAPGSRVIGVIAQKGSLGTALRLAGVRPEVVHDVTRQLAAVFNPKRAQAGDSFVLRLDARGELRDFSYTTLKQEKFDIQRKDDRFVVRTSDGLERRTGRIAGVVSTSLAAAIEELGEQDGLARDFADVFAYDVDFAHGVHRGDEFTILYERLFKVDAHGKEQYLRPGRIFAASYRGQSGSHTAVYFEPEPGRGGYYRPDGSPMKRSFLVAPLRYERVTSGYTESRLHPILGYSRPHEGIDYAAPTGTPVWSVADGKVSFVGSQGGYGNLIKVDHAGGYTSWYPHLSRFAPKLSVGDVVRQKQVIGFVGATGLATGPHVCFRISRDGHFVNPATVNGRSFATTSVGQVAGFKQQRDTLVAGLRSQRLITIDEAL